MNMSRKTGDALMPAAIHGVDLDVMLEAKGKNADSVASEDFRLAIEGSKLSVVPKSAANEL